MFTILFHWDIIPESKQMVTHMLHDKFGQEIHPGDWFVRTINMGEGFRYYRCNGYADGKVIVHEHNLSSDDTGRIMRPVKRQQTIQYPGNILFYPEGLIPKVVPYEPA